MKKTIILLMGLIIGLSSLFAGDYIIGTDDDT